MIKSNTPPDSITRRYIAPLARVLVLAAFLVTAIQSPALAVGKATITVINQTGQTIVAAYYRGNDNDAWDNLNLNGNIPPGETHYLNWTDAGNAETVSLAFQLSDGTYKYLNNVSIKHDSTRYVY